MFDRLKALKAQIVAAFAIGMAKGDSGPEKMKEGFLAGADRAQSNLSGLFVGIMVAAIIGVAVVIPVVQDVIAKANLTGTVATIVNLIPLFVGLLLLISLASPLMRRV